MIVLDACVVIAYLEADDAHHDAATALVLDLVGETQHELVLHPLTAAEVLTGFRDSALAEKVWRELAEIGFTVRGLGDDAAAALLLARTRRQSRLKMPDAVVLATALSTGSKIATFDDALRRAAQERDVLYVPSSGQTDTTPNIP